MNVHTGAASEQTRVLNFLQMYENGSLGDTDTPATTMRALPLMCKTVLDIRRLNSKLLTKLEARSWKRFSEVRPDVGDEILIRTEDPSGVHVELLEWLEEDIEFFDTDSEGSLWMLLIPIND